MKKLIWLWALIPSLVFAESTAKTLIEMSGGRASAAALSESALVVIDAQREYVDGALPLVGVTQALTEGRRLLARARSAGTPVLHIVHRGNEVLFNPDSPYFEIAAPMAPVAGERVIEKRLPNAFAGTSLHEALQRSGRKKLIVVGFMTHMCLESTVRAALDLGYVTTVVGSVTATRDLPDGRGGAVAASEVKAVSLAALADRFATVVQQVEEIPQ